MKELENDELYDEWEDEEKIPIDWDSLTKDSYISLVKFAYQNPGAILMIGFDEHTFDYETTDWKTLFSKYPISDWLTTNEEKEFYNKLPKQITVYRTATEDNKDGISYTTNKLVANYFLTESDYYKNKDAQIYTKTINKTDIRAILLDMDEDEIILI